MITENIQIENIPAILWGKSSSDMFVAVHGNMSSKSDIPITILAEEAVNLGYQVLSFDLPEHGDRKNEPTRCKVLNCVSDLEEVIKFAKCHSDTIRLFANSMGVYFSLLAYKDENLKQSLFLSPLVDMNRIIQNMMKWFNVTEEQLYEQKEIVTPTGQVLYWDYYQYVKQNPIKKWNSPTSILYGKKDEVCEFDTVSSFVRNFNCKLEISDVSEHFFHTDQDIKIYQNWLRKHIAK